MPQPRKTFRVFVSSTFTDMKTERKVLQKNVFPRLKAFCESRGANFQGIDLRWGVNEGAHLDHKTMDICLGEIARCQRLSPKPNFIILLGDKYGWQPVPAGIPCSEMDQILEHLGVEDKKFVETWYREDQNAVPSEYILQSRRSKYCEYDVWHPVEKKLKNILHKTVSALPFTDEQKVKFFTSATHQEILSGTLSPPTDVIDSKEHVFAYFRTIRCLPEDYRGKDYIDLAGNTRDSNKKAQLENLKTDLCEKLPNKHVYPYGAKWCDGCVLDDATELGERVYNDLRSVIEIQLKTTKDIDPRAFEIKQHEEFKQQRLIHFTGRQATLQEINHYLNSSSKKVLAIIGASGTGKTSLIAKAIEDNHNKISVIVFRFIGTSSATSDLFRLLSSILHEIIQNYDVDPNSLLQKDEDKEKLFSLQGLKEIFPRSLNLATSKKPLVIYLDALDQLSQNLDSLSLDWLPREIPQDVKIVVSALPDLQDKLNQTTQKELGEMPQAEGEKLLKTWLASMNRTLQPLQKHEVMQAFSTSKTPLYLKLAFEQAREWQSYSEGITLKNDIDGVLEDYFAVLERNHGTLLVHKICGYLLSGKYQGLMEQEILDLLVFDQEHWDDFLDNCHPDHRQEVQELRKLPVVLWSRLYLDLEPYLTEREADGFTLISLYHRKFVDHARRRYLDIPNSYHRTLVKYYNERNLYLDKKEKIPNIRKVVEQPYQQTLAGRWNDIVDKTLANLPFLMAKAKADMVEGIFEDYRLLFSKAPYEKKEKLKFWNAFFKERAHILRRQDEDWPAHKILLQLAVEHADDSPVTQSAEQYLKSDKVDWPWIRRMQRVGHTGISPCLAVLEGHTGEIRGALNLADGKILSWALDKTLRLWDKDGNPLNELKGHTRWVEGVHVLNNGRILSWSKQKDTTLRLWDKDGQPLNKLKGHTDKINGVRVLENGRILSWSEDTVLRLWDKDGQPLKELKGHSGKIKGVLELGDGRILSWAEDKTLRLWDKDEQPLEELKGHKGGLIKILESEDNRILSWAEGTTLGQRNKDGQLPRGKKEHIDWELGNLELGNGRILPRTYKTMWLGNKDGQPLSIYELEDGRIFSWSEDTTLRLWDKDGQLLNKLKGHTDKINGALVLENGRILSWSEDSTLRFWDKNGQPLNELKGHSDSIKGAIELRDGRILSWSEDNTLRFWEKNGLPLNVLTKYGSVKVALELRSGNILSWHREKNLWETETLQLWDKNGTPLNELIEEHNFLELDDNRILSWAKDKALRLWDKDGQPLNKLKGHTDKINGALELVDNRILSWSEDTVLRLWDKDGQPLNKLKGHSGKIKGVLELGDGRILSWAEDKTLRLWEKDEQPLEELKGHKGGLVNILELEDNRILSWAEDKTLRLWDKDGQPLNKLKEHRGSVEDVKKLGDGRILSWGYRTLWLWDKDGQPLKELKGHSGKIKGTLELGDGKILSWSNEELWLWDRNGQALREIKDHKLGVDGVQELGDGRILFWEYRTLWLWDKDGQSLKELKEHSDYIKGILELGDGRILSWTYQELWLWDKDWRPLNILKAQEDWIIGVLELGDGKILSWSDEELWLWDKGRQSLNMLKGHTRGVFGVNKLGDSRILSRSHDKTLWLWDKDGLPLNVLKGHTDHVTGVRVLRDGRIITWSEDTTLRLWDKDGMPLNALKGHTDSIRGAYEFENGRILSWAADDKFRLWDKDGHLLRELKEDKRYFGYFNSKSLFFKCSFLNSALYCMGNTTKLSNFEHENFENNKSFTVFWHDASNFIPNFLKPDGRMLVTQANGQVCFLQLYYGNMKIGIEEFENIINDS